MNSSAQFTRHGYAALGAGAIVAVIGARLGYSGVTAFGLALVGFVIFSMFALRKLPTLELRREAVPAFPRRLDECTVTLTVRNGGRRAARLEGVEVMGGQELDVAVPYLSPGGRIQIRYPLPTDRCGTMLLGPLRLQRIGLAGLSVGLADLPARHTVTVLPRVLPTRGPDGPLTLIVDDRVASYLPGSLDFEEALDVAASLVTGAVGSGYPITAWTAGGQTLTESVVDSDFVTTVVRRLATFGPPSSTIRSHLRPVDGGMAVGVTGSAGDPAPMVAALSRAARAVLLVVDRRPDRMASRCGSVLVLRALRAEELLVAWDEACSGVGVR